LTIIGVKLLGIVYKSSFATQILLLLSVARIWDFTQSHAANLLTHFVRANLAFVACDLPTIYCSLWSHKSGRSTKKPFTHVY